MGRRAAGLLLAAALAAMPMAGLQRPADAASVNCVPGSDAVLTGGGELRVFAMQHKQDLADLATYQSIHDALDCELAARVDPYRAADHPKCRVQRPLQVRAGVAPH